MFFLFIHFFILYFYIEESAKSGELKMFVVSLLDSFDEARVFGVGETVEVSTPSHVVLRRVGRCATHTTLTSSLADVRLPSRSIGHERFHFKPAILSTVAVHVEFGFPVMFSPPGMTFLFLEK
jgi:hypothetical protein